MKNKDEAPTSTPTPPVSMRSQAKRTISKIEQRARIACVASLAALGLIVWSLVHPKPLPVIVAMSVGQAIGTLSLLFFLGSIVLDLRSRRLLGPGANIPPPAPSNPGKDGAE